MERCRVVVMLAASLLVGGCLFPSVEGLGGGTGGASSDAADGGVLTSSAQDPTPASTTGASVPAGTPDASTSSAGDAAAAGAGAGLIACGTDPCAVGANICCTTVGGDSCQAPSTSGFCTSVEGGSILECDGNEDCAGGTVCCFLESEKTAKCRTSCPGPGKTMCNGATPDCPSGQTCSGSLSGHKVCQ
jgi:hypothetical protein